MRPHVDGEPDEVNTDIIPKTSYRNTRSLLKVNADTGPKYFNKGEYGYIPDDSEDNSTEGVDDKHEPLL